MPNKTEKQIQADINQYLGINYMDDIRVFRNNVGMYMKGRHKIEYGLAIGSSDLIGWHKIIITEAMIGMAFARFLAIEIKSKTGKMRASQTNFINRVREFGGIAGVVRDVRDLDKLLRGE